MSERASKKAHEAPKVEDFLVEDFSGGSKGAPSQKEDNIPRVASFEEFQNDSKPLSALLDEIPSLGYLFSPFDPGKLQEQNPYESMLSEEEIAKEFPFEDMDAKDENIISTLDRAEKKAKEIVDTAAGQRDKILADAQQNSQDLSKDTEAKAKLQADEIIQSARLEAQKLKEEALKESEELQNLKASVDKLKAESQAIREEAENGKLNNEKRAQELTKLSEDFQAEKDKWLSERDTENLENRKKLEDQGYADGLAKGQKDGFKAAHTEAEASLKSLMQVLHRLSEVHEDLWRQNYAQLVDLSVEVAEQILNKEIENGKGLATGAFSACVSYLKKAHNATFRVSPGDLEELEAARAQFRDSIGSSTNIRFIPDPALGPGDLVMESDVGRLDATILNRRDNVLAVLKKAIAEGLTAPPPPPLEYPKAPLSIDESGEKEALRPEEKTEGAPEEGETTSKAEPLPSPPEPLEVLEEPTGQKPQDTLAEEKERPGEEALEVKAPDSPAEEESLDATKASSAPVKAPDKGQAVEEAVKTIEEALSAADKGAKKTEENLNILEEELEKIEKAPEGELPQEALQSLESSDPQQVESPEAQDLEPGPSETLEPKS
ncbi:MAG: hypothetical protein LBE38_03220 [Deltaproteobacteria bacterium]|nr:hypothetical protein [Deltaproteobacteria bacterium]